MTSVTLSHLQLILPSSRSSINNLDNSLWSRDSPADLFDDHKCPYRIIERYKELVIIHSGGVFPKLVFAPVLKACSRASALAHGKQIHAHTIKWGLASDVFVQTSLLSMYSSCGQMESLFNLFDRMPNRNVVSWTVLMDACLRWEQPSMALVIFREMQETGVKPDQFAIVSLLSACARLGTLNLGMWVHAFIERVRLEQTIFIGTALVDMYCKCGSVDNALAVFNSMPTKTLLSWNAMLYGLSVNGRGREAVELFLELEKESGIHPNEVTFVAILCGCSHSGLVKEGRFYFGLMQNKYGIEPTVKHYGCMVDLLGRAGLLEEAFEMVNKMPVPPNTVIWGALLSACRVQNNMGMAERVSQKIIGIDEDGLKGDTSHYVIMSNMYDRAGLMDKMAEARLRIGKKPKGRSWIEIGSQVHEFSVGDSSHPMWARTKEMLDEVMEKVGENRGEENPQTHHSEKVAVAFGLLNTRASTPIRIVKNLRMCADCHRLMKSISKVYKREIVVRDSTRFHRFMEGGCSCKDYW